MWSVELSLMRLSTWRSCGVRTFSNARKKERMRNYAQKQLKNYQNADEEAHDFGHLLRNLYKKSHPDLLRHAHPDLAAVNDQSMQVLNGILSTIKTPNSFPPQMIKDIPFHVKMPPHNQIEEHTLQIRTGGGDCRKHLTDVFQQLFLETKISHDGKFNWGKEYFPKQDHAEVEEEMRVARETAESEDSFRY